MDFEELYLLDCMEIHMPVKGTPIKLTTELKISTEDSIIDIYYISISLPANKLSYNKSNKYKLNIDSELYNIIDLITSPKLNSDYEWKCKIVNDKFHCINSTFTLCENKSFSNILELFLSSKSLGDFKHKLIQLFSKIYSNDILNLYNSLKVDYKKELNLLDFYNRRYKYNYKPRKTEFWRLYFEAN